MARIWLLSAIGAMALPLGSLAAAEASDESQEREAVTKQIVDMYVSMCVQGTVEVDSSTIKSMDRSDLPPYLRDWYSGTPDGSYYLVSRPGYRAILLRYSRPDAKGNEFKEVCSVSTTYHLSESAEDYIREALHLPELPPDVKQRIRKHDLRYGLTGYPFAHYYNPGLGYTISVRKVGGDKAYFTVMQTSFFNDDDRARRMAEIEKRRTPPATKREVE